MNFAVLSGQEYILLAARRAEVELGWKLCHHYSSRSNIDKQFPDSIGVPYMSVCKGNFSYSAVQPKVLSAREIGKFSEFEFTAIKMFDRNDSLYDEMNFSERQGVWRQMLGYWTCVFDQQNVKLAIFEETPHQAIDFAAYCVAKVRNIRTLIPVRLLPGSGYLLTSRIGGFPVEGKADSCDEILPKKNINSYYEEFTREKYFINKDLFWDQFDNDGKITNSLSHINSIISKIFSVRYLGKYISNFKNFESDQKQKNISLPKSNLSYQQFLYQKTKIIYLKYRLSKSYDQISVGSIPVKPFVLCALQYQPELSTCPLAGRYASQEHMVALLAERLPDGWSLLIKEHPSQFVSSYARYGQAFRRNSFYRDILEIRDNIQFVSQDVSIQSLIDASQFVAAPGGSICFEAATRGKGVINFGSGWFVGCPNIYHIDDIENLADFVKILPEKTCPNSELLEFINRIDESAWPGAIGGEGQLEYMKLTVQHNSDVHYKSWKAFLANT